MKTLGSIVRTIGLLTLAPLAGLEAATIANGGFESGLSSWTIANIAGGDGSFSLQTGTASPVLGDAVPAPPEGLNAAMSDAGAPGSHVLFQDFSVPPGSNPMYLTFELFLGNRDPGTYFTPADGSLDFSILGFNQQARVDITSTAADPFSIASGDVLLNVYQTKPGDPAVSGYTTITADLTSLFGAHPGETLRLRFAEVDNVAPFQMGIDNVAIGVPESSAPGVFLVGCAAGWVLRRRNSR